MVTPVGESSPQRGEGAAPVPYWTDGQVTLYLGDMREVLPALGVTADLICTDPPYACTSLEWDRWPDGWLEVAAAASRSMWCFGSLRMFGERWAEFAAAGWRLSHDVIWEKRNGSGFATDRFRRVHEQPAHWYRGPWSGIRHEVPRVPATFSAKGRTRSLSDARVPHTGQIGAHDYADDGLRLTRSVIRVPQVRRGVARTQKPGGLLCPLIEYGCPPGGLVVDCFSGSGATLAECRAMGRLAIGIEKHEPQAEQSARWLSQMTSEAS
jgi:site-specific DNA-methyltransferase (adenine-specific)